MIRGLGDDLGPGAKGTAVTQLQLALFNLQYDIGASGADGSYGPATTAAIKQFQTDNGMDPTGIADQDTQDSIQGYLAEMQGPPITDPAMTRKTPAPGAAAPVRAPVSVPSSIANTIATKATQVTSTVTEAIQGEFWKQPWFLAGCAAVLVLGVLVVTSKKSHAFGDYEDRLGLEDAEEEEDDDVFPGRVMMEETEEDEVIESFGAPVGRDKRTGRFLKRA